MAPRSWPAATAAGVPALELHGNLSQNARTRNLTAFSDGSTRLSQATDIAARGIHVDDVSLVSTRTHLSNTRRICTGRPHRQSGR
ncbi:MAG: helicase-related protein [Nocardioidaceae bacterium]